MKKALQIIKSNNLIESIKEECLTIREKKLVAFMVSCISSYDSDFKEYQFPIQEFANHFNITDKNINKEYEKLAHSIMKKPFRITDDKMHIIATWISEASYNKRSKSFHFRFTPALKPYLIQLKKSWTKYPLINLIHLENCHSETLYELLKQYESIGSRELSIRKLREILGLKNKYPLYANLKVKVLSPAVKEINKFTDINTEFKELKIGKRVDKIKFIINADPYNPYIRDIVSKKKIIKSLEEDDPIPKTIPKQYHEIIKRLVEFGFIIEESLYFVYNYSKEYIMENLDIVESRIRNKNNKVFNVNAYVKKALADDFRRKKTPIETRVENESIEAKREKIDNFIHSFYLAWFDEKVNHFYGEKKDLCSKKFELFLKGKEELKIILNFYEKHKLNNNTVIAYYKNFMIEEYQLKSKFSKELFLKEEGYEIKEYKNGDISVFKSSKKIS